MTITSQKTRILVIDDNPEIHEDYRKILESDPSQEIELDAVDAFLGDASPETPAANSPNVEIDSALQGEAGLNKVREALVEGRPYAIAFVDMRMPPGWDGLQTIEEIWKIAPDLQVVICTAYSDNTWEDIVARVGISDKLLILKKPFDRVEVSQLAVALTEKWLLAKKAKLRQEDLERLVDERTKQLKHAALHDALTAIPNRKLFQARFRDALDRYIRNGEKAAVILLDLDRFKQVNDTYGHAVGDALLRQVAERLETNCRETDTVARLGGDEFAIIRVCIDNHLASNVAVQRWLDALNEPYSIEGKQLKCGVSMGIAMLPTDGTNQDELLRKADLALYRAKNNGRGQYRVFDEEMDSEVLRIQQLEKDIEHAIEQEEFELHYQPIIDAKSGAITTMEALVRWEHPTEGQMGPTAFIPVAEQSGQIAPLGEWILEQACKDAATWPESIHVAVNVSSIQFARKNSFITRIKDALEASGLAPERLEIEVTESVLVKEDECFRETLNELRSMGIQLALDDFGTGHSSLSYLRRFKFDTLKLDRTFVADCNKCEEALAIVKAVSSLGEALRMQTTAEGVETKEQLKAVIDQGYDRVQGFYFAKPGPMREIAKLFEERTPGTPLFPELSINAPAASPLMAGVSVSG